MTRLRMLQTTTVGSRRLARNDEIDTDEATARDLIAIGKAEAVKDKQATRKSASRSAQAAEGERAT